MFTPISFNFISNTFVLPQLFFFMDVCLVFCTHLCILSNQLYYAVLCCSSVPGFARLLHIIITMPYPRQFIIEGLRKGELDFHILFLCKAIFFPSDFCLPHNLVSIQRNICIDNHSTCHFKVIKALFYRRCTGIMDLPPQRLLYTKASNTTS